MSSVFSHSTLQPTFFCLERFEWQVHANESELACHELIFLLEQLDAHYAQWGPNVQAFTPKMPPETLNRHICTRIAGAITTLFSRPGFTVSDHGFSSLMNLHRWLAIIFSVSSYCNGDHIIRNINAQKGGVINPLVLNLENLKVFCLSYYPDSQITLQPDQLWQLNKQIVARLFFALISPRAQPTIASHKKREQLLAWLPERLSSLSFFPESLVNDVYMNCSYADLQEKHQIKYGLNQLIRNTLLVQGYHDIPTEYYGTSHHIKRKTKTKPVILVILEWFNCQHSVYRTHSQALTALKTDFTVHAMGLDTAVDDLGRRVFDFFYPLKTEKALKQAYELAHKLKPDIVFYVGIGMFPYTILLSNLRLAPLQLAGLGHGASTFCDQIDGFVVEEDFIGNERCFSEKVIPMARDAMPFVSRTDIDLNASRRPSFYLRQKSPQGKSLPIRIAVCASIMKINPRFIHTLKEIKQRSSELVLFCFYTGSVKGLEFDYLRDAIQAELPDSEVNANMNGQSYIIAIAECDLFVSPFPYGNMNSLVDTISLGLPGVCMTGVEPHSHIDGALMRRVGLPDELIASNEDEYICACLRLIEDHDWRESLQNSLLNDGVVHSLFCGEPNKFTKKIMKTFLQNGAMTSRA
ncbi:cobalt ABC transporter permease [Providencia rettgeri]|uniref:cobalt ABC transporter permease n=1 Tax=Providencia rettgeri TaxID=587 RepID=UPI0001C34711|nr:cobalt ABC transporter permease [Providencia rettgeri]QXA58876.1 cobalt ABC transporter permease [Providencia rettgeri]